MNLEGQVTGATGRGRGIGKTTVVAALSIIASLISVEIVLRGFPTLLPPWYRASFPAGGIEFFQPGILARTPIEGVPLPYRFGPPGEVIGPAPRDLETRGLVSPEENLDSRRYPRIRYRIDSKGFPNPAEMHRADVVLVGDSFTVATGLLEPPGLQTRLAETTGLEVFNLAVPSIGPQREAWLLETIGLGLEPRAVVWMFFGGNDLEEAERLDLQLEKGIKTYADLFPDFRWPRSFLIDFLTKLSAQEPSSHDATLPGFVFAGEERLWLSPNYLQALARNRAELASHRGWGATKKVLRRVARRSQSLEIRLLVVYVPTKEQVYLPHLAPDSELTARLLRFGGRQPPPDPPDVFWKNALAHRGVLERLLEEFCAARRIDFLSLTPELETLAAAGKLGYFAADSHWNEIGQATAVAPLAGWLAGETESGSP